MGIAFGNLLWALGELLHGALQLFIWLFIIRAVLSWFSPDPRNALVQFLYSATEPILSRIRHRLPSLGVFDISVIVVILGLAFIDSFVSSSLIQYGHEFGARGF